MRKFYPYQRAFSSSSAVAILMLSLAAGPLLTASARSRAGSASFVVAKPAYSTMIEMPRARARLGPELQVILNVKAERAKADAQRAAAEKKLADQAKAQKPTDQAVVDEVAEADQLAADSSKASDLAQQAVTASQNSLAAERGVYNKDNPTPADAQKLIDADQQLQTAIQNADKARIQVVKDAPKNHPASPQFLLNLVASQAVNAALVAAMTPGDVALHNNVKAVAQGDSAKVQATVDEMKKADKDLAQAALEASKANAAADKTEIEWIAEQDKASVEQASKTLEKANAEADAAEKAAAANPSDQTLAAKAKSARQYATYAADAFKQAQEMADADAKAGKDLAAFDESISDADQNTIALVEAQDKAEVTDKAAQDNPSDTQAAEAAKQADAELDKVGKEASDDLEVVNQAAETAQESDKAATDEAIQADQADAKVEEESPAE